MNNKFIDTCLEIVNVVRYVFDVLLTLTAWVVVALGTMFIMYQVHELYPKQVMFSLMIVISWLVGDKFLQWVWGFTKSGKNDPVKS